MSGPERRARGRLAIAPSLTPRSLERRGTPVQAWQARIITLFPEAFPGVLGLSLTGKALKDGLWGLETFDLRSFGIGKHRNVDDTPAGGGAGMVLRADVLGRAVEMAMRGLPTERSRWPLVCLSPRGRRFDQATAASWAQARGVTLICGRFEGIDQRVIDHFEIEEISLGDFVMTGGELPAQAMIDATVRLLPDVLGNSASAEEESFSSGLLEHPQYTRPAVWAGRAIPEVLTSGNHAAIARWRQAEAEALTKSRRPDLWQNWQSPKGG
ncbi:MAG: tRNA (guanosine(37)-N1)-methyltransferase TrmD [Roseinatronobacter sp.]